MQPVPIAYYAPDTAAEALGLFLAHGVEAKWRAPSTARRRHFVSTRGAAPNPGREASR